MKYPWTDEEQQILLKMYDANCSMEEMKKVLVSRSEDSIRHKLQRLGLKPPYSKTEINYELFDQLMEQRHASNRN